MEPLRVESEAAAIRRLQDFNRELVEALSDCLGWFEDMEDKYYAPDEEWLTPKRALVAGLKEHRNFPAIINKYGSHAERQAAYRERKDALKGEIRLDGQVLTVTSNHETTWPDDTNRVPAGEE
jgi:hypothetical protein